MCGPVLFTKLWKQDDERDQCYPFLPGLSPVAGKLLTATFDAGRLSFAGRIFVVGREIALQFGLADVITKLLSDKSDPLRVTTVALT